MFVVFFLLKEFKVKKREQLSLLQEPGVKTFKI